jgi:small subunit ribosomal protein S21
MNKKIQQFTGRTVFLKEYENVNQALKRFKRKVDDSNILETLRKKEFYEKPSNEKKRKAGAARARWLKKLRDQEIPKRSY